MRWKKKPQKNIRIKKKFLILPEEHNGETRWLEWAEIEQFRGNFGWLNLGWVDRYKT